MSLVSLALALLGAEVFLRLRYLDSFWQPGLAARRLYEQAQQRRLTVSSDKTQIVFSKPLYRPDPVLGYSVNPGVHEIELETAGKSWAFHATVDAQGRRATSPAAFSESGKEPKEVWIFGDSLVWGWPLSDEQTFPWLVQEGLGERARVINFAAPGYGNTHALLELRRQVARGRAAVIVVAYGDYFRVRNVAAPVRLGQFRLLNRQLQDATHPRASLDASGDLAIDYVPLIAGERMDASHVPGPPDAVQNAVTIKLMEEIKGLADGVGAVAVLAYVQGSDTSPVIDAARDLGFIIADLRLAPAEWDSVQPFDAHPGVLAHRNFARRLLAVLNPLVGTALFTPRPPP